MRAVFRSTLASVMDREVGARVAPRSRMARSLEAAATVVAATVALGCWAPISASAANSPYFTAPFTPSAPLPSSFGQAPSWATNGASTTNGGVLSGQLDSTGIRQIYYSPTTSGASGGPGTKQVCLTCTTVQGPNGLPQERPQGDWILFESYGQQSTHEGNPGLGGYGGDLYVMHPDGTGVYRLTTNSDPNFGLPYSTLTGTPYDNFHAYWSPNGQHVVWTHLEADPLVAGGEKWEILLGDFTVTNGVPSLTNVTVVGPPYGAYETEPWSPDGNGFIFMATGGHNSPFQTTAPGWGNARIYYMRVYGTVGGKTATPANPMVTPLTDNLPVYTEQAVFTPDEQDVIMMTDRSDPSTSWTHEVMSAAQNTGFDDLNTGSTQTVQFLADFLGSDFTSDLWIVDSSNLANPKRLTYFNQVVPEFFWNSNYTQLLWNLESSNPANIASYTGQFSGIPAAAQVPPATTPAWLTGQPIDMARVGAQAQVPTQLGPVNNVSVQIAPPSNPAPAFPHAASRTDTQSVPLVATTYVVPWQADLTVLGAESLQPGLALQGLARIGGL